MKTKCCFDPGSHLFIPYIDNVYEVVVTENQSDMHMYYVRVFFPHTPKTDSGRFVNPRGVLRSNCHATPQEALEAAMRYSNQAIRDYEYKIKLNQQRLADAHVRKQQFRERYFSVFGDNTTKESENGGS